MGAHLDFKHGDDGGWLVWCDGGWRVVSAVTYRDARDLCEKVGYLLCGNCGKDVSNRLSAGARPSG